MHSRGRNVVASGKAVVCHHICGLSFFDDCVGNLDAFPRPESALGVRDKFIAPQGHLDDRIFDDERNSEHYIGDCNNEHYNGDCNNELYSGDCNDERYNGERSYGDCNNECYNGERSHRRIVPQGLRL